MNTNSTAEESSQAKPITGLLLAIVSVHPKSRVRCQNPGCGHGVYAAIHVVEEDGQILVLGSTCYAKRYGNTANSSATLSGPSWGSGQQLSDKEREMLVHNTAALIERFQQLRLEEDARILQLAQEKQRLESERHQSMREASHRHTQLVRQHQLQRHQQRLQALENHAALKRGDQPTPIAPAASAAVRHPWPWQHPTNVSVAVVRSPEGRHWVRVQHRDASQKLVPWPAFEGWEHALPAQCGEPDPQLQAYSVPNIVLALQELRRQGYCAPEVSRWPQVQSILPKAQ